MLKWSLLMCRTKLRLDLTKLRLLTPAKNLIVVDGTPLSSGHQVSGRGGGRRRGAGRALLLSSRVVRRLGDAAAACPQAAAHECGPACDCNALAWRKEARRGVNKWCGGQSSTTWPCRAARASRLRGMSPTGRMRLGGAKVCCLLHPNQLFHSSLTRVTHRPGAADQTFVHVGCCAELRWRR